MKEATQYGTERTSNGVFPTDWLDEHGLKSDPPVIGERLDASTLAMEGLVRLRGEGNSYTMENFVAQLTHRNEITGYATVTKENYRRLRAMVKYYTRADTDVVMTDVEFSKQLSERISCHRRGIGALDGIDKEVLIGLGLYRPTAG